MPVVPRPVPISSGPLPYIRYASDFFLPNSAGWATKPARMTLGLHNRQKRIQISCYNSDLLSSEPIVLSESTAKKIIGSNGDCKST